MTTITEERIPVEAHFTGACSGDAMFTLMPLREGDNVHMGVRLDDLIGGKFVPTSFPHNSALGDDIVFDETNVAHFMRDTLCSLRVAIAERSALYDEQSMTSDTARYNELNDPHGPLRNVERRVKALQAIYTLTFHAVMGFWPRDLRDMGI
jgi:hypothetical protein